MHKHIWEIINQFTTESEAEVIKSLGYKPQNWNSFKKKYITDFHCLKCGKLIRKVVKN